MTTNLSTDIPRAHLARRALLFSRALLALLLLVAAGCGDDSDDTSDTSDPARSDDDPGDDSGDDTDTPPDLPVVTIGRITLSATGIGEGVGSFGQEAESVLLEIAAEMAAAGIGGPEGSPTFDSGYRVDDAETSSCYEMEVRKVTWDDFSVILKSEEVGAGETLVGWVLGDNDGVPTGLTTPEGIAIGTPSTTVEAIYGVGAFGDTGDDRYLFSSPDLPAIRGITDAPYPDGGVTILAAGTDCLTVAP